MLGCRVTQHQEFILIYFLKYLQKMDESSTLHYICMIMGISNVVCVDLKLKENRKIKMKI